MDIELLCNTPDEIIFENIEYACELPIEWVKQEKAHDGHAVIVGGGPSIKDEEILNQIKWRQGLGQTIFALNGAANFLIEEGIPVENQVILDPRPENVELLSMKVSRYYLASQCDVELFHCLFHANKLNRVSLWHPKIDGITDKIAGYKQDREILLIGGGVTVGLRSEEHTSEL